MVFTMNKFDIYERCENFSIGIIELVEKIPYRTSAGIIGKQLIRSATSIGANLNEADNARSDKEFLSILGICLKEAKETQYWLKLLKRTNQNFSEDITNTADEAYQIIKILGKIFWIKAKNRLP